MGRADIESYCEKGGMMGRRRPEWMRKPNKPLPFTDNEPQHKEDTKSPKRIFIERADGTIEVIKEA